MDNDLQAHLQPELLQNKRFIEAPKQSLRCIVYSNHPLALCLIEETFSANLHFNIQVERYSTDCQPLVNGTPQILFLDTCSIPEWIPCFEKWREGGGIIVALVSSEPLDNDPQMQMLHLGATGILNFNDNLYQEIPRAIQAVAAGQIWIRREVLNAYVDRTRMALNNLSIGVQRLTSRESEILNLLQHHLTSRNIAHKLAISERTVKFHISNLLRKLNLTNRKELLSLRSAESTRLPDFSKLCSTSQPCKCFPTTEYS